MTKPNSSYDIKNILCHTFDPKRKRMFSSLRTNCLLFLHNKKTARSLKVKSKNKMKETRLFYTPDIEVSNELPLEEAQHIVKVLRLKEDDIILLTDGKGYLYEARITLATTRHCSVELLKKEPITKPWPNKIHIAVAPTKNMDRNEWMVEKTTEIGVDHITFLDCDFSERHQVRADRIEKIAVAAMKQSHKMWKPKIDEITKFKDFIAKPWTGQKFIAHCYSASDFPDYPSEKPLLQNALQKRTDALVCIGPEGDFSIDEVKQAMNRGFIPISLGSSRLRTETAAIIATHLLQLFSH